MKISYISGTDAIETDNINSGIGRTGIEWGESINYNFKFGEKTKIRTLRVLVPLVAVRGMMLKLIEGNRGGLGDILYALSPFNKEGKINQLVKNQYDAFMDQAKKEARALYPFNLHIKRDGLKVTTVPDNPTNFAKYTKLVTEKGNEAKKKFKYIVYPASNTQARKNIEI